MQCEVHDKLGNHCPNEVSHKFQFRDKEVHLCDQCFANVCSGAYAPCTDYHRDLGNGDMTRTRGKDEK